MGKRWRTIAVVIALAATAPACKAKHAARLDAGAAETTTSAVETTTTVEETTTTSSTTTTLPKLRLPTTTTAVLDKCAQPDRTRILFWRRMPTSEPIWHVFSINADGSCKRQLTHGTTHTLNWGASWSPDGTHVAFIRHDGPGPNGVFVADWNGEHERLLLAEVDGQPSGAHTDWSPDGTKLLASREHGIWVVDVATGAATHLGPSQQSAYASWSPDGKQVTFSDPQEAGGMRVMVINADGSGERVLSNDAAASDWGANNRIVMDTVTGQASPLVIVSADGSDRHAVPGSDNCGQARWNVDATRIVCSIGPGGMKVFDPVAGFLFVVDTGAGADASGGNDYADDW